MRDSQHVQGDQSERASRASFPDEEGSHGQTGLEDTAIRRDSKPEVCAIFHEEDSWTQWIKRFTVKAPGARKRGRTNRDQLSLIRVSLRGSRWLVWVRKRHQNKHLDFDLVLLRTRRSGVRVPPGAPLFSCSINHFAHQCHFQFPSQKNPLPHRPRHPSIHQKRRPLTRRSVNVVACASCKFNPGLTLCITWSMGDEIP